MMTTMGQYSNDWRTAKWQSAASGIDWSHQIPAMTMSELRLPLELRGRKIGHLPDPSGLLTAANITDPHIADSVTLSDSRMQLLDSDVPGYAFDTETLDALTDSVLLVLKNRQYFTDRRESNLIGDAKRVAFALTRHALLSSESIARLWAEYMVNEEVRAAYTFAMHHNAPTWVLDDITDIAVEGDKDSAGYVSRSSRSALSHYTKVTEISSAMLTLLTPRNETVMDNLNLSSYAAATWVGLILFPETYKLRYKTSRVDDQTVQAVEEFVNDHQWWGKFQWGSEWVSRRLVYIASH